MWKEFLTKYPSPIYFLKENDIFGGVTINLKNVNIDVYFAPPWKIL